MDGARTERTPDAGTGAAADASRFLTLLWLFIWSVLRILRTDIYAPTGAVMVRRGLSIRGVLLPSRQQRAGARHLVVTEGPLTGARITLSDQPVLVGRADDSTLVINDDYASTRHARLSQRGRNGMSKTSARPTAPTLTG